MRCAHAFYNHFDFILCLAKLKMLNKNHETKNCKQKS